MSERLKSASQITNEEVIEELTKDVHHSLKIEENPGVFVVDPSTSAEKDTEAGDSAKMSDIPPQTSVPKEDETEYNREPELDSDPDEDKGNDSDTNDAVDEEHLKNLELILTDVQKEEHRVICEELKETGNYAFKIGDYKWSVEKYTSALQGCPLQYKQLRAVLYCNRSAARMKQEKYDKAIHDCTKALELDNMYIKAYIRRAQSYEQKKKLDESLADFKKVLELDPSNKEAQKAINRLPPLIEENNEKLKAEMLGKLKDLGNMILKPFGLSTDNFQMDQDPDTKGYKINFKQ